MANSSNPTNGNECQPLLERRPSFDRDPFDARSVCSDDDLSAISDCSSEIDEATLDSFAARFGTSVGTLGLDGAAPTAFPIRRFSISQEYGDRVRRQSQILDNRVRRQSQVLDRQNLPGGRRKSYSTISTTKSGRKSSAQWDHIEEVGSLTGTETSADERPQSKYLGGVSEARFWAVFGSILLVYFIACFDSTLMASSHPAITSYFKSSNSASWLSTSFLLTSTAFQPVFGRLSDTIGRRPPFIFTLVVFTFGTLCCALAPSIMMFILARAVCGLGAGGAMALGTIIASDLVPIEIRGQSQSMLNLAFGIGASLGAALGGFLADTLGWRWEFGIQVPVVLLCSIVAWMTTPDDLGPQLMEKNGVGILQAMRSFDLSGSALLTSSVTLLILAMNLGGNVLPWSHPLIISAIILCVITGAILLRVEKGAERPIMPLKILFSRPRGYLVFSNFLASMTMNTILFNIPLYFQAVLLDSATTSGTKLILPFLFNMTAGFSTGFIITWTGRMKPTLVLGYIFLVVGSVSLSVMGTGLPSWQYTAFLIASGLGQGFSFPSISLSVLATSHIDDLAVATSVTILCRSLGTVMGVAVSSLIVQNALFHYLEVFVEGPNKQDVIRMVRKSVSIIASLPEQSQLQVIAAYAASLRFAFICAAVTSTIALLLVLRIRLPRLGNKHTATVAAGE